MRKYPTPETAPSWVRCLLLVFAPILLLCLVSVMPFDANAGWAIPAVIGTYALTCVKCAFDRE